MTTGKLTIYPYATVIIYRSEVQEYALARPIFRNLKAAVIPDGGNEVSVTNAGQLALRTEGNCDLLIKSRWIFRTPR